MATITRSPEIRPSTLAPQKVDDYTWDSTNKKDGKVTTSAHIVISKDARTAPLPCTEPPPTGKQSLAPRCMTSSNRTLLHHH